MAIRAKLTAPREAQTLWPWHKANWRTIPSDAVGRGDRRMEASSYLSGGYGIRLAIEAKRSIRKMSDIATAWQPSRLKGIQLGREFGTPFLAATQVFDLRPTPRKFLSLDRTQNASERFIEPGTIVVTCSGTVGRSTLTYAPHAGTLISHDLLRILPKRQEYWGWIYAYLRAPSVVQMMTSAQYGHMIKHLEPSHIHELPVPVPRSDQLTTFQNAASQILESRNAAWTFERQAEQLLSSAVGEVQGAADLAEQGFIVRASTLLSGRRRLEATYSSPEATGIVKKFHEQGLRVDALSSVTEGVWWLSRFRRVFGEEGDPYYSADDLFSLNSQPSKKVIAEQAANPDSYRVHPGWIIMACSGQTYGLNGSVAMISERHQGAFFSHDLIRIIPKVDEIRGGYLFAALGHPDLGRPLVIRNAYGTSIPHLDPEDVAAIPIVRLGAQREAEIADLMDKAVELRCAADELEESLAVRAERLLQDFLEGDMTLFQLAPT